MLAFGILCLVVLALSAIMWLLAVGNSIESEGVGTTIGLLLIGVVPTTLSIIFIAMNLK